MQQKEEVFLKTMNRLEEVTVLPSLKVKREP